MGPRADGVCAGEEEAAGGAEDHEGVSGTREAEVALGLRAGGDEVDGERLLAGTGDEDSWGRWSCREVDRLWSGFVCDARACVPSVVLVESAWGMMCGWVDDVMWM